jgi:hypothetical protein
MYVGVVEQQWPARPKKRPPRPVEVHTSYGRYELTNESFVELIKIAHTNI